MTSIMLAALCGCSDLYKQQEKICLDTKAYGFTRIEIISCGKSATLTKVSKSIWSTDGLITIGNCDVFEILGVNDAGENIEISKMYHVSQVGKGVVTKRYDIVDLSAKNPWDRVKITGYANGKNLQCDADIPLPESLILR